MKILYAVRLFSGLQTSVESQTWKPTGVPTIFKMIEHLDRAPCDATFVLACKDGNVSWPATAHRRIAIDGLSSIVTVLAGKSRYPGFLGRLRGAFRELDHFLSIWRLYRQTRPDVVYLDHSNVFTAGLLASLSRARIVFRVMGVYPVMRSALQGGGLAARMMRWCYRRRFAVVICSQDGSGCERWLEEALRPDVPRHLLLNGLDREQDDTSSRDLPFTVKTGRTTVLFVGKLETEKGALEFTEGFIRASERVPGALQAILVGTGSLAADIRSRFETADQTQNVTMIDRMPHADVMTVMRLADIYVSLNRLGNLSNVNLEAMASGCCMVIPSSQSDTGIDLATDMMLGPDAALRIASSDDVPGLAEAIVSLHNSPARRKEMGRKAWTAAASHVPNWHDRIGNEHAILQAVAGTAP